MSKYEFAVICIAMACMVLYYVTKAYKNKNKLGQSMMKVLIMGVAVILSYTVTLISNQYFIISAGNVGVFICIDWLLFFLLEYTNLFIHTSNQNTIIKKGLKALLFMDSLILVINPFCEIAISFSEKIVGNEIYLIYEPKFWFYVHVTLCYLIIAVIVIKLVIKCIKIPNVYRGKYSITCFFLVLVVLINAVFLITEEIYIDLSILSYGLITCVTYYITFDYKESSVINRTRALIVESMPSPAVLFDLEEKLCIINKSGERVFGLLNRKEDEKTLSFFIESQFSEEIPNKEQDSIFDKIVHINGSAIWYHVSYNCLRDEKQQYLGSLFVLNDITSQKKMLNELDYAANNDYLTGIHNRNYLSHNFNNYLIESPLGVVLWNLNGLHLINDFYGIELGDCVICRVVEIIKENIRKEDVLARWNGDEFLILLPGTREEQTVQIMNEIQQKISKDKNTGVDISAEFGVAMIEKGNLSLKECLTLTRNSMYQKKLLNQKSVRSSILESLKKSLSESDYETEEHAERTKKLAVRLGEKLGMSDRKLGELGLLAILHDIGKVSIPDSILLKPDKLTEEEWVVMKNHTVKGYEIARITSELETIAEYILHHHERWDGTGYPEALSGCSIPLLSRIISVVDSYDVMTHNRPYHKAISKEQAIAELLRCSGTQFDPEIVNHFIEMISLDSDTV